MAAVVNYGARHEFLRQLHELLRPATYLEIGVQTGRSLALALPETLAIGVDPNPMIDRAAALRTDPRVNPTGRGPKGWVTTATSDAFFAAVGPGDMPPVDLAFIDGMHLAEYALRDFMGVERLARLDGRTVAVFDDVLPYSADIAGRTPLPGDWAGDVWKIIQILEHHRPDLTVIPVNVQPTGALVVLGLDPASTVLTERYPEIERGIAREFSSGATASGIAYEHRQAVGPAAALGTIRNHLHLTTEA